MAIIAHRGIREFQAIGKDRWTELEWIGVAVGTGKMGPFVCGQVRFVGLGEGSGKLFVM
jgi:hypothetical protein